MERKFEIEPLESLEAPGWGEWVAGIGVGAVVGGALIYGGIAIGVAAGGETKDHPSLPGREG